MAQTTRTTNDVIVNALYLIGELGVNETPDAFMLSTGIDIINELLEKFTSSGIYIPFLTTLQFPFTPGQATYSISDIITNPNISADRIVDLVFANYTVEGQITYPLQIISKATYYSILRLPTLDARPGFVLLDKQATESFVTFYPAPDRPYVCNLQVKSMIDELIPYEDIGELPPYFYGFLKYAVGRKFLGYYPSANWSEKAESEYQEYWENIKSGNDNDVTVRPTSLLNGPQPYSWYNILAY